MSAQRRAFTIIELLITLGVVLLLASLLLVALRGVRESANRTESANALRQIAGAFNSYTTDNGGMLMPGYLDVNMLAELRIGAELASGKDLTTGQPADASAYVWRLAPYLDHNWKSMFVDYRHKQLLSRLEEEYNERLPAKPGVYGPGTAAVSPDPNAMGIATIPAYGMNTIFVGGDNYHGGTSVTNRNPWRPAPGQQNNVLAATRLSEVKNPARLMVFAPSTYWDQAALFASPPVSDVEFGTPALRPPFLDLDTSSPNPQDWIWTERQWEFASGGGSRIVASSGADYQNGGGWPITRWGKRLPIAHLDGSVSSVLPEDLAYDMRLWAPFATNQRFKTPMP